MMARQRYSIQQLHSMQAQSPSHDSPTRVTQRAANTTVEDEPTTPRVRSDWSQWSADYERKRIAANVAATQAAIDKPIYPRELAEKIAGDYVKVSFPDWWLLRLESRHLFGQLVKQQPEMMQREIKQRHQVLTLLRDNLPSHIAPLVTDLENIYNLIIAAQESAAFMVGFALGRKTERAYFDHRGGIVRTRRQSSGLALTDGEVR